MANGRFEDFICLIDDTEFDVMVTWEGYHDRGDRETPPWDEMEVEVELIGDWPEGLTNEVFKEAVKRAQERHLELAWEEYHAA